MNESLAQPSFVAFSFDYSRSEWRDLPHLRDGIERLVEAWKPHMTHRLSALKETSRPTDVMEALEDLFFSDLADHDSVLIYIGGHGVRVGDDHFVAGPEAKSNLTVRSALAATDLAQVVGQGRPRQISLILDACYSGAGAARLSAAVDAVVSRERRNGLALFVMSSARALDATNDGVFVECLLDVLTDAAPTLWTNKDKRLTPSQVGRALRSRLGDAVETHEHGFVEPVIPNLAYWQSQSSTSDSKRRAWEHFLRAASGLESGGKGWFFVGRDSTLEAVTTWLRDESAGVFVVTGPPGSGKSAILGRIALLSDQSGRDEVTRRDAVLDLDPKTTPDLGSVTVAIHAREKSFEMVVREAANAFGIDSDSAGPDDVLAKIFLREAPAVILVDALDEAAFGDAERIASFLREIADLPNAKALVGTRPDRAKKTASSNSQRRGPILRALEPDHLLDLHDDETDASSDIAAYVSARLSASLLDFDEDRQRVLEAISKEVSRRVGGVFLYARLMVQILQTKGSLALTERWRDYLPRGGAIDLLTGVVDEDLERIPSNDRIRVRSMLMALGWAEGEGLPRYHVWPAIATAITGQQFVDADVRLALEHASWYLAESAEYGQPVFRLNHEELIRHFRELTKNEF